MPENRYAIEVSAKPIYMESQSDPAQSRYVFTYTITVRNSGSVASRLMSRHWIITDADMKVEEVRGPGVVGETPHLKPGESFEYSSYCVLATPVGTMRGSYEMHADDGHRFEADIPEFTLSIPRTLH